MVQAHIQPQRPSRPRPARTPKHAATLRRPLDHQLDPQFFRALGDPTRLKLLACLAKCARPCSVGEVAQCCSVDLSVVSRHLATLARSGVLEAQRAGQSVRYRVPLAEVAARLRSLADAFDACRDDGLSPETGGCCDAC